MLPRNEMLTELATNVCRVVFTKKDGEVRDMECTRSLDHIPTNQLPKGDANTFPNETVMPVYDVKKGGWRSFIIDNVTLFERLH